MNRTVQDDKNDLTLLVSFVILALLVVVVYALADPAGFQNLINYLTKPAKPANLIIIFS